MSKKWLIFLTIPFLTSACAPLATGSAEVTGLSLLHDRRTSKALVIDEGIEIKASIALNSDPDIRSQCHFNVTAYNGQVLVTGEAPTESLRQKIISTIQLIHGIKLIHNELKVAKPSSFSSRSLDTLITTKVKSSLSHIKNLPGFDATRIKVITEMGTVYLLGLVHPNEGNIATEVTRREDHVKQVVKIFEYIK